jgi:RHS repeat-associated protein
VVGLTNASGNTVEVYEYDVYGRLGASDASHPNRFLFTGREYDKETGLYYYRARYYNPQIGRFLQTDPVGYKDGMNCYQYCKNNSVNLVDPSGLFANLSEDVTSPGGADECPDFASSQLPQSSAAAAILNILRVVCPGAALPTEEEIRRMLELSLCMQNNMDTKGATGNDASLWGKFDPPTVGIGVPVAVVKDVLNSYLERFGAEVRYQLLEPGSWCVSPDQAGVGGISAGAMTLEDWMTMVSNAPIMFWQLPGTQASGELEAWLKSPDRGTSPWTAGTWPWTAGLLYDITLEMSGGMAGLAYWHFLCGPERERYCGFAFESAFSFNLSNSMLYSPILVPVPTPALPSGATQ